MLAGRVAKRPDPRRAKRAKEILLTSQGLCRDIKGRARQSPWLIAGRRWPLHPQDELGAFDDEPHRAAGAERPEQERLGQWFLHDTLDEPRHGTRAERAVEPFGREPRARLERDIDRDPLRRHHDPQLVEMLIHDALDFGRSEGIEIDDGIEPIPELGRERPLQRAARRPAPSVLAESHSSIRQVTRPRIGGHDEDHVAEVRLAPMRVGQRGVIHHLQQDSVHVRVCLLDLIEQQHRVR